jgi:hypothetical protein
VDITARISLASAVTPFNLRYLITKRDRLGHQIQDLDESERAGVPAPAPLNGNAAEPHPAVIASRHVLGAFGSSGSSGVVGSESA